MVDINYKNGEKTRLTFLKKNLFRLNMEPDGKDLSFKDYAEPNNKIDVGRIQQQVDSSDEYSKSAPIVVQTEDLITISTEDVRLEVQKANSMMRLVDVSGETEKVVWEETAPI